MNNNENPNITDFGHFIDNQVSKETYLAPKSKYSIIKVSRPSRIGTTEYHAIVNLDTHELLEIDGDLYDELEYSSYEEFIELVEYEYLSK